MATKQIIIKVPASTTEQTVTVNVNIPDPVVTTPPPVLSYTQGKATVVQPEITETHVITGTGTTPPPIDPPPTTGTRANIIFESQFEAADPLTGWGSEKCKTDSLTGSTEQSRAGKKSLKVYLRKTDTCTNVSSIRAEVKLGVEKTNNPERWYGASYLFPAGYKADPQCPEIVLQWHHNSGTGSPPLAFWSYGDKLMFNHRDNTGNKDNLIKVADITPGKWMDIVCHIKFSSGSDGLVEIWINGAKVYTKSGANNYAGSTGNCYLKTGIYRWGWANGYPSTVTERIIYIDEFRVANEKGTYTDVAP